MKKFEILLRKLLLRLLLFVKSETSSHVLEKFSEQSKILFIRLNRIGDALITTPLLNLIKKEIGCKVYVLSAKSNHFIFQDSSLTDKVIVYNKKTNSLFSLIKLLNKENFDAIVDLHDDVSTTVSYLVAFIKCKFKFGLKKGTEKLYTHTIQKMDPKKHHVINRVMAFSKLFGLQTVPNNYNIIFRSTEKSLEKSKKFIKEYFSQERFLLGINISAGNEARFWGIENYSELVSSIIDYKVNVILMCAEQDLEYARVVSKGAIPIFHNPDFNEFSAMIYFLDILFTPDTSIVHIGSAFNKPVFGLYVKYNTQDMIWSPYKSPFDCVITEEPTLKNVKLETVKEKFIPFFEKYYYEYSTKPE